MGRLMIFFYAIRRGVGKLVYDLMLYLHCFGRIFMNDIMTHLCYCIDEPFLTSFIYLLHPAFASISSL